MGWTMESTLSLTPAQLFKISEHLVDIINTENGVEGDSEIAKEEQKKSDSEIAKEEQKKSDGRSQEIIHERIRKAKAKGKYQLPIDILWGGKSRG